MHENHPPSTSAFSSARPRGLEKTGFPLHRSAWGGARIEMGKSSSAGGAHLTREEVWRAGGGHVGGRVALFSRTAPLRTPLT